MISIAQKLLKMKDEIKQCELDRAEAEGRKKQLLKSLKECGCLNVAQAERKAEKMEHDMAKLERQLEAGMDNLEHKYDWER